MPKYLKQLSLAAGTTKVLITECHWAGWGFRWVGDPESGVGKRQRGFLLQLPAGFGTAVLYDLQLTATSPSDKLQKALAMCQVPLAGSHVPD